MAENIFMAHDEEIRAISRDKQVDMAVATAMFMSANKIERTTELTNREKEYWEYVRNNPTVSEEVSDKETINE